MTISVSDQVATNEPQDNEVVLSVQGVSKKFCRDLKRSLFYGVQDIATELIGVRRDTKFLRSQEFWALKDVSFELRRGEALGLVGKNGSGKTTLLRIISGLIRPDAGSVEIVGRVAPLIALGAGFNPILTGRENIYANMAILGLAKKEIDDRFDEVVKFAEVGDAIDAPVQSYSSGMAARLGFASAIHTDPDILLIDEVLAVGDIKFKTKCYAKLQELRQKQKSFIMVSHSSHSIATVCESAVYLQKGTKILSGDVVSVMNKYEDDLFLGGATRTLGFMQLPEKTAEESTGLDITSIFLRDQNGNVINSPISGESNYLVIECVVKKNLEQVTLNLGIRELSGESRLLVYMNSWDDDFHADLTVGKHEFLIQVPYLGLGVGLYDMRIAVRQDKIALLDKVESFKFAVKKAKKQSGVSMFYQPRTWDCIRK